MSRGGARVWGNTHPAAQLTEKKVARYRALVRSGKATVGELAAREGCSHGRISMAVRGETWAHLNDIAPPVAGVSRRSAASKGAKTGAKTGAKRAAKTAVTKGAAKRGTTATKTSATKRLAVRKDAAKKAAAKTTARRPATEKKTTAKRTTARR